MERRKNDNRLSVVVLNHINSFIDETGIAVEKFTRNKVLPELIKAGELTRPLKDEDKWEKTQSRRLVRYIDGENQLHINWVFPFIASLPEAYRQPLKNELCGMLGSYFVALTASKSLSNGTETRSHLPQMAKEWGDILVKANPAMDGAFTPDDDPVEVLNYANEIAECIGFLMAELGAISRATNIEPSAVKAFRNSTLFV